MKKKLKLKDVLKRIVTTLFAGIGLAFVVFVVAVYFLDISGVFIAKPMLKEVNEKMYNNLVTYNPDARSLAINITRGCGGDEYCYLSKVYIYMMKYDYIKSGVVYPFNQTISDEAGDCKNFAYVFSSVMTELDVDNEIKLNDEMTHAYNYVYIDGHTFKVDLTAPRLERLDDDIDLCQPLKDGALCRWYIGEETVDADNVYEFLMLN